ncbi:MAG: helix-turn-helix transcriptional regulator [Xenococcaceae cyanobacterium MO_167.B27]|nr:helix-turn-helix transcriptional regulator [Xenococcaceae cyanobacterium MO_167.B27]
MISSIETNNLNLKEALNPSDSLGFKPLKTEQIKNNKTSFELIIIYTENSVILQVFDGEKFHKTFLSYEYKQDTTVVERIKQAWEWESEDELIATAKASENILIVMGCDLNFWQVPFDAIPCLNKLPLSEKTNFEIDRDGSYLHWQWNDVHIDLEDIKAAVDPEFKNQLYLEKLKYNQSLGKAISQVRKAHNLNQNEIEGLSDRHLRRIENEGYQVTIDVLKKLAVAHNMNLEEYLAEVTRDIDIKV